MNHRTLTSAGFLAATLSLVNCGGGAVAGPGGGSNTGAGSTPVVLVGAGDIANCNGNEAATALLLDAIAGTVFTTGDNVYPIGAAAEYANCYEPTWGRHKARTRPSAGNHDYGVAGAPHYYNYFGASAGPAGLGYYSYELGDWHIVVLNSNIARGAGSVQEQWLRNDLAANTKPCTLAYWHHPLFNSGASHGNDPSQAALFKALYDHHADVIVNGHEHIYERFAPQNVNGQADPNGPRVFIVGTGGVPFYGIGTVQPNSEVRNNTTHGVIKFTLKANSYDWQFVPVAGRTFADSGTASCVNGAPPVDGTQVTLNPSDGWDSKNLKTLLADARLDTVTGDDLGHFLSLQFDQLSGSGSIKRVVRNNDPRFKKARIDKATLVVTYGP